MMRSPLILALAALLGVAGPGGAGAQTIVQASAPEKVAVTIYRDPDRGEGGEMNANWPQGFAMISETRTVTLPAGKATIRFEGVAESMAAVSAIVSGLPGGVIEKNRNGDLLSPAALVDGTLGNRVTISRTNPATGQTRSEDAIVRTRADGGLVLQTREGYEAVRCAGLPETLSFHAVPDGLSAQPVFSINVDVPTGGTYKVTLSYLASGFDWQAHYVATFADEQASDANRKLRLLAWLTLANNNGQSFADAELLAVAGKINLKARVDQLAPRAVGEALSLTCFPLGSTSEGIAPEELMPPPPMAAPAPGMAEDIVVTGARREMMMRAAPVAVTAAEEQLGDLKLYRVPIPVTVAARSVKQIAFLEREGMRGDLFYAASCSAYETHSGVRPLGLMLATRNDKAHGLGAALPMGGISVFAPVSGEELLLDEAWLRDYAVGQEVELSLGASPTVRGQCEDVETAGHTADQLKKLSLTNANSRPVRVRVYLGEAQGWTIVKAPGKLLLRDGQWTTELTLPAGRSRVLQWRVREAEQPQEDES